MKIPQEILNLFENIPANKLLQIAYNIRSNSDFSIGMISQKEDCSFVTKADHEIQKVIIDYFLNSDFGDQFYFKAEEVINQKLNSSNSYRWQLIIDPIDGTAPYSSFQAEWGVMVGLCDPKGELLYSWNLLASGEIYSSASTPISISTSKSARLNNRAILLDFYSYSELSHSLLYDILSQANCKLLNEYELRLTTYPSGIYSGWNLYTKNIDALLWISSSAQKQAYPDYDLIFLGALKQQDYKIILGKIADKIEIVIATQHQALTEDLWELSLLMLPQAKRQLIKREPNLLITPPLQ